ncbi:lysophospholipid transporter LplT [Pseudomethylobacillus aquaticus]|uniref:Lysophospholipid transporter LplT n=1 Tax=Pseudomethylobacillus aquaticus TaxID=2676064 RepID=A0A3N0UV60_9PROT|nr:lysophospholipid transporter LplT [Pseudomethylobacillus aquaticus]ROH84091.1 lysophospholipid transporter LplT [Pseudomethylobacillus aquaticus]
MNLGFYTILLAQFLSALADNALLFAAIALLQAQHAPDWHTPLLLQFFVISYIVLAPFVGAIADAFPKGRVMFVSNSIKFVGGIAMLLGMPPLYAYGIVGIGAAAYSPAKYGILTEYLPPHALVKANGWMEGSTVMAIILGAIVGGKMAAANPEQAVLLITLLYVVAAVFNYFIPRLPIDHKPPKKNPLFMIADFWHSCKVLWRDPQGQVSLAVTTLFWGAGATLRLVVLAWAGVALMFDIEQATQLIAIVAVGIAIGSVIAARWITLEQSTRVLPAGIIMGMLVIAMAAIHDWRAAGVLLFAVGVLSGYFVVPLNALLQHRGHLLIGAGHSIAVQNFNENLGILIMIGIYTLMLKAEMHINLIVVIFGLFVMLSMTAITRLYRRKV